MASTTSLQVAGLASNFDWKSFVDQLMAVQHAPADRLATEKTTNTQRSSLLATLGTKITTLQTTSSALSVTGLFGKRTAASTTTGSTWGAAAAASTANGNYRIAVTQLATAAKFQGTSDIGSPLAATNDVSGLTVANLPLGTGISAGTFSVNGAKVTVALTDSLQDVFTAISTATGGAVTAGYDAGTDKVTLTGSGPVVLGAANDTSNFLRALKLGNNGTATTTSTAKLGAAKTSAALGSANLATAITAVDGAGAGTFSINGVSIAFNKNTDTISSLMTRINQSTAGVTASYDNANDRMILSNNTTGDVGISVSESAGGVLAALGLTGGSLVRGQNAEFTLDGGATLTSLSNTLDASSHGIAGLSVTVDSETTQTIAVKSDTASVKTSIQNFLNAFNDVQSFIDSSSKITVDSKGKVTAAALAGNRDVQGWTRELRSNAFAAISGLTGSISRLENLGIDFKSGTNELEIKDESKLTAALANKSGDVAEFFQTASTGFAAKIGAYATKIGALDTAQQTNLTKANASLDEQISAIERRLEQERLVMESAFIAMETAQSNLKNQQTALTNLSTQLTAK